MGELLQAAKRRKIPSETLEKAIRRAALMSQIIPLTPMQTKTENSQEPDVPQKLKERWAKEDIERINHEDENEPKSECKISQREWTKEELRAHWEGEDAEAKLRKNKRGDKHE